MTTPELEMFDAQPDWRLLLAAYGSAQAASESGWVPRIPATEGLAPEPISAVHGKLIAFGFLKFEIGPLAQGLQYQLTPAGRQALLPPESRQILPDWMQAEEPVSQASAA